MPDLAAKKADYLSSVVRFSEELLTVTRHAEELALYRTDNEFQAGAANAITDADAAGANAHLTAALVNEVVQVAADLAGAMTAVRRTRLRRANRGPQI